MPKRILMIIDGLPGGGAEKVVLTLCQGLMSAGHSVSLFSLRNICDYAIPPGLDFRIIADNSRRPWRKLTEHHRRAASLDKAIYQSEISDGKYALIFSHLHKTDRIVSRCRTLDPLKTWYCLHGVFSVSYLKNRRGFSHWLKQVKIRRLYQRRQIVAVSQYVLDDLIDCFGVKPSNAKVIGSPFDFENIQQLAQQYFPLEGSDYLLHIGRFHEVKRHDRLLEAYASSGITAPLILLGQGSKESERRLRLLAEQLGIDKRVRFEGFQRNPYPWIRHARMVIVSSDSEGFGNVLIEALSCQTPVVSTRCPGGPVSILTGTLARGLAESNAVSLAEKMREIYDNPPDLKNIRLDAYSIGTVCERYLQLAGAEPGRTTL